MDNAAAIQYNINGLLVHCPSYTNQTRLIVPKEVRAPAEACSVATIFGIFILSSLLFYHSTLCDLSAEKGVIIKRCPMVTTLHIN